MVVGETSVASPVKHAFGAAGFGERGEAVGDQDLAEPFGDPAAVDDRCAWALTGLRS
jgi:hypothetical protein